MDVEEIKKKVERFVETMKSGSTPVVFCFNCGSTNLDQNAVFHIQCYECRNSELWNGLKFAICRKGDVRETASMLRDVPPIDSEYWNNWQSQSKLEILSFGKLLANLTTSTNDESSAKSNLKSEQYEEIKKAWEELKIKMDKLIG